MKKILSTFFLLLWLLLILTIFYIVQKPDFLSITHGLGKFLLTILIPAWMSLLSTCIGSYFLPDCEPTERVIFGSAIGMGIFGLTGFGLAITGWATQVILFSFLTALTIYFAHSGRLRGAWLDINQLVNELRESARSVKSWIPAAAGISIGLAFLMGLAPPIEDFDALSYHLAVPNLWLRTGSLISTPALTYWFPHIIEGIFIFPLSFGIDTATHLLHLFWLVLSIIIIWYWAKQVWENDLAWYSVAIILTMPSLLWLASWAYNDFALTFTGVATIYALWKWKQVNQVNWLIIAGIMGGIALGIKYTSFFILLVGLFLLLLWKDSNANFLKTTTIYFISTAIVASPWYIRNWLWISSFIFPKPYWDTFLAQRFPAPGPGIGFDIPALLLLPLTATLGTQDANYFDGRFGPFFLILLPVTIWALWKFKQDTPQQRQALLAINLLAVLGILSWTISVVQSLRLFQARYLFPALIPAAITLAIGVKRLNHLDTTKFKISFIFRIFLFLTVLINIFNFSLQLLVRNPLLVATGITTRQAYLKSRQPEYASALELVNQIPKESRVYLLFEPRSYGMAPYSEPDILNTNFQHSLWLYHTPEKIINAWREQGYTHVLISRYGQEFVFQNSPYSLENEDGLLAQTENLLIYVGEAETKSYVLYQIP